jgi:hypothetical protein
VWRKRDKETERGKDRGRGEEEKEIGWGEEG